MNKQIKLYILGVVVVILILIATYAFAKPPVKHTIYMDKGETEWSGECIPDAECGTSTGTEQGKQYQECKEVDGEGEDECKKGDKRSMPVVRECKVELIECPEPTPEPTPIIKIKRPDLDYTQGPDGILGDGKVRLKWDNFKDCSKVKIKYTDDGVFGNGYKTIETSDDGSEWIMTDVPIWAKVKCDKDDREYSDVEKIHP